MRNIAAVFFLALSLVGLWLISRQHGFSLSHLLPSPGDKHAGVINWAAPLIIILLTLWALSRLTRRGDSASDSRSSSSAQCPSPPSDAAGDAAYGGDADDSEDDVA